MGENKNSNAHKRKESKVMKRWVKEREEKGRKKLSSTYLVPKREMEGNIVY